ncbi:somatostatin receptor type 2-like protein [Dinothrombium tinctorium]|uniref:Somatostatin receptor type 2-like protein n=1 Tax=Dinothrombium tinctorium TaxID=1965070 RepID=A0A3S3NDJ8_9ACAR|nr:somatostatin receptor type 2-like protein [Dinothrombium tinctorium]
MLSTWDYFLCFFNTSVFLFGFCANIVIIFIIIKYHLLKHSSNVLILNLSIADCLSLCRIPFLVTEQVLNHWPFGLILCKAYRSITLTASLTSCFSIILITIERYFAVCHPLKVKKLHNRNFIIKCCSFCWVIAFVFRLPSVIYANLIAFTNEAANETCVKCVTEWPKNLKTPSIIVTIVIGFLIPCSLIIFVYYKIITTLMRSKQFQTLWASNSARNKRYKQITLLAFSIVASYLIFWIPYWTLKGITKVTSHDSDGIRMALEFFSIFRFLHSATNPLLYFAFGPNFRKHLRKLCQKEMSQQQTLETVTY